MNPVSARKIPLYWLGLALGPAAWAINLQGIYAITPYACARSTSTTIVLSIAMALTAASGSWVSLRAIRRDIAAEWTETRGGRARNFMAWLSVGCGVLFALVILNQLTAALMISPCLR
ncbi:hypothetical protein [Bradyrhizobium archetypum]|uniref:Uncharacterized protein n=1 Tax=Bradyrhizobium archetypum TaxID=2721160 RepID=A0A7Y4H4R1_9BRAD|nr:hypothetical protein [Bradyrhizobium archetypum]NOJ47605.1 hypothetical protein [Bradyrhizobium archetypum]